MGKRNVTDMSFEEHLELDYIDKSTLDRNEDGTYDYDFNDKAWESFTDEDHQRFEDSILNDPRNRGSDGSQDCAGPYSNDGEDEDTEERYDDRPEYDGQGNEIVYDEHGNGWVHNNDGSRHAPEWE